MYLGYDEDFCCLIRKKMKKRNLLLVSLLIIFKISWVNAQVRQQGFEGTMADNWNYTPTPSSYNEAGGSDIWEISTSLSSISASTGSSFWGAQDLENPGSGGTQPHTLDFDAVNISALSNVNIAFKYYTIGYDGSDSLGYYIEYDNGTTWSNYVALDKNTNAWTTENISAPVNAQYVRIRFLFVQNGGSDYAAIDDIEITTIAPTPNISFDANFTSAIEGGDITLTIDVVNANASPISFDLTAVSGFGTASSSDYNTGNLGTLVIPANTNGKQTFTIATTQDNAAEADEYFAIRLSNAVNADISGNDVVTAYIKDDDKKAPKAANNLSLKYVGGYTTGDPSSNSAEIVAYDEASKRLFIANSVANSVDIVSFANPTSLSKVKSIDISSYGGINSIATYNGIVATAIENGTDKTQNGKIVFMDTDGTILSEVTAGALPDMITFTPDGKKVLCANEGEPETTYSVDPEGSVTIVDISGGVANITQANVKTATFTSFNAQEALLKAAGVRVYGPGSTLAQDLEPEYIVISDDSKTAYVACQENNALAVVNIDNGVVTAIAPIGYKDHSIVNNALDVSDKNGEILLANWPIKGMYQPDGMDGFTVGGVTYVITANEGDAREYDAIEEEERVKDLNLDATAFPFADILKEDYNLGRMTAVNTLGDTDNDGDIDEIYVLGGRSFSIWNANTGALVYDSKDDFERILKDDPKWSSIFNASNSGLSLKNRSDNKGPEPEGVVTAVINDSTYAFIGLERIGGVMTYNISNPANPVFVGYVNNRSTTAETGDLGPEGIIYINENESGNGKRYVIVANEVSATLSVFEVESYFAPKSTVNFAGGDLSVKENSGSRVLSIELNPKANYDGQIVVDVTNGAGAEYGANKDYVLGQNPVGDSIVLNVVKGAEKVNLTMAVVADTLTESDETVTFTIRSVSKNLILGGAKTLVVTIENVNPPAGPNGIDELNGTSALKIYPNPATNGLINLSQASSGVITDINGKAIVSFTDAKTIDISTLQKGVYMLTTKVGQTARIVVQ